MWLVGLPSRLTSFWIISFQISPSNSPFPPSPTDRLKQLMSPWFVLYLGSGWYINVSSCWLKVINYPQKTLPPKVLLGGTLWGGTSWVHQSPVIRRPEVDFLAFTLKVVLIVTTPIHRNTAQALDAVRKDPIIRHQCTENCQTHKQTKCNFQTTSSMKMQRSLSSLPPIIQMQMTQFLMNQWNASLM